MWWSPAGRSPTTARSRVDSGTHGWTLDNVTVTGGRDHRQTAPSRSTAARRLTLDNVVVTGGRHHRQRHRQGRQRHHADAGQRDRDRRRHPPTNGTVKVDQRHHAWTLDNVTVDRRRDHHRQRHNQGRQRHHADAGQCGGDRWRDQPNNGTVKVDSGIDADAGQCGGDRWRDYRRRQPSRSTQRATTADAGQCGGDGRGDHRQRHGQGPTAARRWTPGQRDRPTGGAITDKRHGSRSAAAPR